MDEQKAPDPTLPSYDAAVIAPHQYPSQPGYPPQDPSLVQPGYAPQPGYPPQLGYPPQPGYPPQTQPNAYPPQPGYPPQGYPPQPAWSMRAQNMGAQAVTSLRVTGGQIATNLGYNQPPATGQPVPMSTIVATTPPPANHNNNLALALIACICCNGCCLGLVSLIYALKSDSAHAEGRENEARTNGEKARKFAIAAIIVSAILTVFIIIGKIFT